MFNFFKKNKPEQPEADKEKIFAVPATSGSPDQSESALKESIEDDRIAIHVMPGRFRNQPVKQDSAKTVGLIIISVGAVFLIVASAALYYFLFRKPNIIINQEPTLIIEDNQPAEENQIETEINRTPIIPETLTPTEIVTLPTDNEIATTTIATTTVEIAPVEIEFSFGADGDNDGLTDMEEIFLSASPIMPDTDGDGYLDGSELINLYNPAGEGQLIANPNISLYENKTFAYDLLYPLAWETSVNGGDDSLMFKTGDNQFVQVIVQPNANKQTLDQWYIEQLSAATINEADRVSGANLPTGQAGWQGVKSPDGLNIYLMDEKNNYIFNITYNPGGGKVLEYPNIFLMMIKSFNLKD